MIPLASARFQQRCWEGPDKLSLIGTQNWQLRGISCHIGQSLPGGQEAVMHACEKISEVLSFGCVQVSHCGGDWVDKLLSSAKL